MVQLRKRSTGAMAMDEPQAAIWQGGQPILTSLAVSFLHGTAFVHSASSWSGFFTLPDGGFIAHGGPYELVLTDGRRARILIRETRPEDNNTVTVEFSGVGPFPHPA